MSTIDERVKKLGRDDPEALQVFAAIPRAIGDKDEFAHLSDEELASALLELQDMGLISIVNNEENEEVGIILHTDHLSNQPSPGPSRRERRKKRRKGGEE